ncbi:MAG: hypothetical protein JWO22_1330 [Frankiales bacterium]|nr:hypothetical protein [Frankiales bacterium]
MLFALTVLLGALALGWARGGTLDHLGHLPLRFKRLVVAALVVQVLGGLAGGWRYPAGLALSAALVAGFLALNRGIQGTGLVAVGLLLNALVVGVNGAMPVSGDAMGRALLSTQDIISGADPRHELIDASTHLPLIADRIPFYFPRHPEIVSTGDVLVASGLAELVVLGMGSTARRRRR